MKRYIKSSSERPYLYIFKHGVGPGTLPKDVDIVKTKDLPNGYTAVWLDRFLTTSELKQYDIPSETRINELLGRIGYCQKNGDVVPCDDVEACGDIKASTRIYANSDCYLDTQTGDTYTYDELKEYWYSFKDWDYSLDGFTSFEDWFNTSIENGLFTSCDDVVPCSEVSEWDDVICSTVMASADLPFSKKARQYAQSAWNKGMTTDEAYNFVLKNMTADGYHTNHESVPSVIQDAVSQLYEEEGDPNDPSTWGDTWNRVQASRYPKSSIQASSSDICYRDRDNDDSVVALDAGMSDEDVEKMLAEHPSYYRSTLDRFEACNDIMASTNGSQGDFTVIQEIYDDFYEPDNVPPVYTQEYEVNLDEVLAKYPQVANRALKDWSDETFKAGDMITDTLFAHYVEYVVQGESDQLYSDFKDYVAQHPELPDPYREIEVRINNPQCLPSAEEIRRRHSEEMGRYLGKMLGLGR